MKINDSILQQIIKGRPSISQFIKFILVGLVNTSIDFFIYIILRNIFHIHFLIANLISFIIANINSFILNRKWTFRHQKKDFHAQYIKFFLFSLTGLGINAGILYMLVKHLKINDLIAKCVAIIIVTFWNFITNKFWTFRTKQLKNI